MIDTLPLLAIALVASQPAEQPGLLIATEGDLSTNVRLVETADAVQFEFTGPDFVLPSVAIDVNRNGIVDRNVDFQVGLDPNGSSCLQYLLREGESSICKALGSKGKVVRSGDGQGAITTFTFPKSEVSGDGFGVGFAVKLRNNTGNFGTTLASGDYRFGGKLQLVSEGPNFKGEKNPDIPPQMIPAMRLYEGCLHRSIRALEPIDRSQITKLKAVPAGCAADRTTALQEGVESLVQSGIDRNAATGAMQSLLTQLDSGIDRLVEIVDKSGIKDGRIRP